MYLHLLPMYCSHGAKMNKFCNIEQLAKNLINSIEESDKKLGCGDRCTEENEALEALKYGLNNLPVYATCYTPLSGDESKWNLADYKDDIVCIMVVFSDGQCIVDRGGDMGFLDVHIDELTPWIKVDSVNTKKEIV